MILNLRNDIENTEVFKNLEKTRQIVTGKKDNVKYITENFIIAKTIGYETWDKQANTSPTNRSIIKELLEKLHTI